jgi:hypothetical protein
MIADTMMLTHTPQGVIRESGAQKIFVTQFGHMLTAGYDSQLESLRNSFAKCNTQMQCVELLRTWYHSSHDQLGVDTSVLFHSRECGSVIPYDVRFGFQLRGRATQFICAGKWSEHFYKSMRKSGISKFGVQNEIIGSKTFYRFVAEYFAEISDTLGVTGPTFIFSTEKPVKPFVQSLERAGLAQVSYETTVSFAMKTGV